MRNERFDHLLCQSAPDEMLAIALCPERGLGVRLLVAAPAGAVLDRFDGVISAQVSQHSLQIAPGCHIADTRFIGFLSHGCAPNARLDMARRELVALRAIAADEWLTIDYAETEDKLHRQFACHCGAAQCRGWIVGREDAIAPEGRVYLAAPAA